MVTEELRRRLDEVERQISALDEERSGLVNELFLRAKGHPRFLETEAKALASTGNQRGRLTLVPRPEDGV